MVHPRVVDWYENMEQDGVMLEIHDEAEACLKEMDTDGHMEAYWEP